MSQSLFLDPALRDWVLLPIFVVMIMVGILRHYATLLLQSTPKPEPLKSIREQYLPALPFPQTRSTNHRRALGRSMLLRQNAYVLPRPIFELRKRFLQTAFQKGEYLKDPENRGAPPANPLTDPSGMDAMMNMMKSNMVMFIPQTVIMAWINFFFSGFVLCISPCSLPFADAAGDGLIWISETPVPADDSVQEHVTVWSKHPGSRRPLGLLHLMVLPKPIWTTRNIRPYPRRRQW